MRDPKTGRIVGQPKQPTKCCNCKMVFQSYASEQRKYCSISCYYRSLLDVTTDKLGVTAAERQARYRKRNRHKSHDSCVCGKEKLIRANFCLKCTGKNRRGENHPQWRGGWKTAYARLRNRRIRDNGGSHTEKEWLNLKQFYSHMCLCCKKFEPDIKLSKDHIIPLIIGGTDDITNIQPLCKMCNSIKHTKSTNYIEMLELTKNEVNS